MKEILDKLEAAATAAQSAGDGTAITLSDTVSLGRLHAELLAFFAAVPGFDQTIINRPDVWSNFGGLLIGVLIDLPLIANGGYPQIQEFRFAPPNGDAQIARVVVQLRDGRTLDGPITTGT